MNTENNKIIAEFLGWTKIIDREGEITPFYNLPIKFRNPNGIKEYIPIEGFIFESDWNWLMEVVEKIESLEGIGIDFYKGCIDIYNEEVNLIRINRKGLTKIEAVYNACVEFIKWYNENK